MAFSNGLIPDSALATIARNARLLPGPAKSFTWICDEVERRYGWRPRPTGPLDAYRPKSGNYYAQTETFLRRYTLAASGVGPFGDVRYWNGLRYVRTNGAPAAVPGTSNHGWACAADVADLLSFTSARYRQFAEVAAEAGWSNAEGRSIGEFWHWVDVTSVQLVKAGHSTTGVIPDVPTITPIAPPEEVDLDANQSQQLTDIHSIAFNVQTAIGGMQQGQAALATELAATRKDLTSARKELARIGTRLKEITAAPTAIRGYYLRYLGREPVQTQLDARVMAIVNGSTLAKQRDAIQNSDEAKRYAATQN